MDNITRRKFLHIGGSLALGGMFIGVAGNSLWKMFLHPDQLFYDSKRVKDADALAQRNSQFVSPYRRTFGFVAPDEVTAFELNKGSVILATPNNIYIYGISGELQNNFPVPSDVRDMAVYDDQIYLLYGARVEVYSMQGDMVKSWDACSEDSDYCSLTVFEGGVFVTDASNKNICKYNLDGTLARFINSPKGFIVPSYSFGITNMDGAVYASNPGRHLIEQYTADGEFVSAFGKAGAGDGEFSGCCNPVILTTNTAGEILTSEKGVPRISCYTRDGQFRSVLLDQKALGGGHVAYDMRVYNDKLIVVGGDKVSVFQYNRQVSQQTLCGTCDLDCPMKVLA